MDQLSIANLTALPSSLSLAPILITPSNYISLQAQTAIIFSNEKIQLYDIATRQIFKGIDIQAKNQFKNIKKVIMIGQVLGVICEGRSQLFGVNLQDGKIQKLQAHLREINDIVEYQGGFATCSKDLTVRLWDLTTKNKRKQIMLPFAYTNHKQSVTCLSVFSNYLLSGSQDRTLNVYCQNKLFTDFKLQQKICGILSCSLSGKIVVLSQNCKVYFFTLQGLIEKKLNVLGTLEIGLNLSMSVNERIMWEIDACFIGIADKKGKGIVFVDIDNMEVVKRVNELRIEGSDDKNESVCCVGGKGRRIEIGMKEIGIGFAIL